MLLVTLDCYRSCVALGDVPVKTDDYTDDFRSVFKVDPVDGTLTTTNIYVMVTSYCKERRINYVVRIPINYGINSGMRRLTKIMAKDGQHQLSLYPLTSDPNRRLRFASVIGVGPFSTVAPGPAPILEHERFFMAGLDIEQSSVVRSPGGFVSFVDPLISIAIYTSTGQSIVWYSLGYCLPKRMEDYQNAVLVRSSSNREMAESAMDWIIYNRPDYLCIHNGFQYDIKVLAANCSSRYDKYFVTCGGKGRAPGLDLNIRKVTVLDTLRYLDALARSRFPSMGLNAIALALGLPPKLDHPSFEVDPNSDNDLTQMIEYNVHDANLHIMVAVKSGMVKEINYMAGLMKSPMSDVTKYISGTLASSLIASYTFHYGMVYDWAGDAFKDSFKGAYVASPTPGVYEEVAVYDFTSLYPSIMAALRISNDTVGIEEYYQPPVGVIKDDSGNDVEANLEDNALDWDGHNTYICIGMRRVYIYRDDDSVIRRCMTELMHRKKNAKNDSEKWAVKISINSLYGAFGSFNSICANRLGASCVTAAGRYAIAVTEMVCVGLRCKPVYGDTDSIFISLSRAPRRLIGVLDNVRLSDEYDGNRDVTRVVEVEGQCALKCPSYSIVKDNRRVRNGVRVTQYTGSTLLDKSAFHKIVNTIFKYTPLSGLELNLETVFSKVLLLSKKYYFGLKKDTKELIPYVRDEGNPNLELAAGTTFDDYDTEFNEYSMALLSEYPNDYKQYVLQSFVSEDEFFMAEKSTSKGLAYVRKDRPKIMKELIKSLVSIIMVAYKDKNMMTNYIQTYIANRLNEIKMRMINPTDCCFERKVKGAIHYVYRSTSGDYVNIHEDQMDIYSKSGISDMDYDYVHNGAVRAVDNMLLRTCGWSLGSVSIYLLR